MKKSGDLHRKLKYFSIAIVLVPMMILYLVILTFFNNRSIRENQRYAYYNILSISHALDSAFIGLNELTLYLLSNSSVRSYMAEPSISRAYAQVNASMQFLPFSSKYYSAVSVYSEGNQKLHSGPFINSNSAINEKDKNKADSLNGSSFLSVRPGDVSLVRLMRDTNRLSDSLGYIKVQVNQAALHELLASPENLPKTSYLLLCEDGVMLQNGEVPTAALENEELSYVNLARLSADSKAITLDGKTYLYSSRPVFNRKVVVVSLLDKASLYSMDSLLIASIIIALALSAFFVVVLVFYYTRWVFDPITRLGKEMTNIENRDFQTDFPITGNNEITVLAEQFQLMCQRIKQMHEQVFLSELKRRDAELAVLESEINPHFLYNTLDTIYWMSEMSHTWKISEMVKSLSNLFRIALQKTVDGLAPLTLEQEYIQCYLMIQQVRYQDQISFEFYIQDGLDDQKVIKLLLQPIIENAIIHGVEPVGGGRVVINIYREDEDIIYKVFNDGQPVDIGELTQLMAVEGSGRRGLAIRNVNERIRIRFGEKYGLTFENPPSGGVLATVRQPAIEKAKEESI